ncbi:hypothetical protein E2C01_088242 [Portunus trituberculatus]|uniref:Uncharacterized protein n=1 Tax=Portunus trituberculatus TaxID=210409 RepID=A0A5B7J8P3_PORTR|nr:hypothetical protein [Portunus trituberculatus]
MMHGRETWRRLLHGANPTLEKGDIMLKIKYPGSSQQEDPACSLVMSAARTAWKSKEHEYTSRAKVDALMTRNQKRYVLSLGRFSEVTQVIGEVFI